MIDINVPKTCSRLESVEGISDAGAAPEDRTEIIVYQVHLESAKYLNDSTENKLKEIVRQKSRAIGDDRSERVVYSSKDSNDRNSYWFWIWVYSHTGLVYLNGQEYHIIGSNNNMYQIRPVPNTGEQPIGSESHWVSKDKFNKDD